MEETTRNYALAAFILSWAKIKETNLMSSLFKKRTPQLSKPSLRVN